MTTLERFINQAEAHNRRRPITAYVTPATVVAITAKGEKIPSRVGETEVVCVSGEDLKAGDSAGERIAVLVLSVEDRNGVVFQALRMINVA